MDVNVSKWAGRWAVAVVVATVVLITSLCAQETKRTPNPDLPERGVGRIPARDFFERFPDHPLYLVSQCEVLNDDFGVFRPGERLSTSFMVAAVGEKIGINHKTAPHPIYEMVCSFPSKPPVILRPDIGNT